MAVGDDAKPAVKSYLAAFREATWGTYPATAATNSVAMEFLSSNFKTEIKSEKLDTFGFRGMTKSVQLERTVMGTLEGYLHPYESPLLWGVALGNGITSSSISGGFIHSMTVGNITDTAPTAISFNFRKGDHVFNYVGGRVDSMKITANVGEVAKVSYEMIFKDSTIGATDISASLSYSSSLPFTFVQGVYRYAANETAAATSTVQQFIQGFELTVKNNLKADADARALGTALLTVLPATRREVEFKVKQRFDTTTTYNSFIQGTTGAIELVFTGPAFTTTSAETEKCTIRLPKVIHRSGDTEVSGSGDILKTEIVFDCLMDTVTSAGREIGVTFQNNVGSYTSI